MTVELVTNGRRMLMIARRPAAYGRRGLGPKQRAWIAAQGWLAGPRVERKEK